MKEKSTSFIVSTSTSNDKKSILEQMEIVRKLDSIGQRLRQRKGITLKQPILNYAFGGYILNNKHKKLLAECFNIYNQGYDFANKDFYYITEINPKIILEENKNDHDWDYDKEGNLWVALDFAIPEWLKKIGDRRKFERDLIQKRQKNRLSILSKIEFKKIIDKKFGKEEVTFT